MAERDGGGSTPHGNGGPQTAEPWGERHELALLRSAVRAIGEALVVTGADLDSPGPIIEYVNPGFERMTGYAAQEVIGRSPRFLQGPLTDRAVLDHLHSALRAGHSFQAEAVNYRKDGTTYDVEWLITPVLKDGQVVHWVAAQRDVTERKRTEERQKRLVDELNHRVNNALAAVQAVATQTFRDSQRNVGEVRDVFRDRLLALSRVHVLLAKEHWEGAPLQSLAERQLMPHRGNAGRIDLAGPEVRLAPSVAVAFGMALHELLTNALRHGALSRPEGHVRFEWSVVPDSGNKRLQLHWAEKYGPPVSPPPHRGLGSRLIERGFTHGLRANVRMLFEPSGLRCEVDAPLATVVPKVP
ncbi:HWE histidine kinase domain-containing protein [Belnapia sp. F-4-1]|uniref:HWE histidine kinase domain-containing protein n=1 Tax=Belnapia sp. F-4-1 TaxID=1545443 RepID=UPI0009DD9DDA|nr:HWE histidine kinase domain-containing protein [Belnapia sp. F-4-1]